MSIGTAISSVTLVGLRHQIELLRERTIRLGLIGHDPRFRLHADQQRHRIAVDLRLRRDGAPRLDLKPEVRQALPRGAERNRAAQLDPFGARRGLDERIGAIRVSSALVWSCTRSSSTGFDFIGDAELDAADRQHDIGDITCADEVRRQPPVRRNARSRRSRHHAVNIGVLIDAWPARFCTCWPTLPPIRLPSAPPTALAPLSICRSRCRAPRRCRKRRVHDSAPDWPYTAIGPRSSTKLNCAPANSLETGLSVCRKGLGRLHLKRVADRRHRDGGRRQHH